MLADERLREGHVQDSLAQLQEQVRKDPANAKNRIFLSQLLAVCGEWERSLNQLNVVRELDAGTLSMVHTYREALRCEVLRAEIFAGKRTPMVFGQPEKWLALLLEALRLTAEGSHDGALSLRQEALELAPATAGSIDGQAFEWIADADTRIGPVLEAIFNGAYYWVPFQHIREVRIEEPSDLRDLVWMPAQLIWANGGGTVALLPTRYPGSEASDDSQIQLSRKTTWSEPASDVYLGLGQRILATDSDDYPLMDVRLVSLDTGEPAQEEAQEGAATMPAEDPDG
jgi:type VI secretion system protein ImpE